MYKHCVDHKHLDSYEVTERGNDREKKESVVEAVLCLL